MRNIIFLAITFGALFSTANIKTDVENLSSTKMEGRKPGTAGGELAKNYLINRLEGIGLQKINGSYTQSFSIFVKMEKHPETSITFEGDKQIFEPLTLSDSGVIKDSEVVFAGYGITYNNPNDQDFTYNDYSRINVDGKIVILLEGDPGNTNPESIFRKPENFHFSSIRYKLQNAVRQGAKAVLFITAPSQSSNYPLENLSFDGSEAGGERQKLLVGKIQNELANRLFGGIDTKLLEKLINDNQRSFSLDSLKKLSLNVELKKKTGRVENIWGFIPGRSNKREGETVVLGAHFDHLGYGGSASLDPKKNVIHPGADDNASGTASVLAIAKKLVENPLDRNVLIVLFNAEEMGLLGAGHFVNSFSRLGGNYGEIKFMYNFDMVGRYKEKLQILGTGSSLDFSKSISQKNFLLAVDLVDETIPASDHFVFLSEKIPSLFFTTGGHQDYHRSTDTAEKINYTAISSLVESVTMQLKTTDDFSYPFNPDFRVGDGGSGRDRGYGAKLGCIPEFGVVDGDSGVLCVGISEESPAEKAGLRAKDRIIAIGEIEIKNLYDLSFALKYYRPGDEVRVIWLRNNNRLEKSLTLEKR
ncbi:MAG: M28 family peptidase [Bdellovibrionales bacterium]